MGEQLVHGLGVALEELPLRQVEPLYHPVEIIRPDHPGITSVLEARFPLILCGHSTLFIRLPRETVWKSERGRSMTYAPEHGKVLFDRSIRPMSGSVLSSMSRLPTSEDHRR